MDEGAFVPAGDGKQLYLHQWLPERKEDARAAVQIVHGMAEHGKRYAYLAGCLTQKGYAVYAQDLRGHGKTAESEDELGYIAEKNGWNRMVEDVCDVSEIIQGYHPSLPLFLLGHSMGSYLARAVMYTLPGPYNGVVLSATGNDQGMMGKLGRWLADRHCRKYGTKHRDKQLDVMSFGSFNKKFRPNRTSFDWLSRDEKEVDKYIEDPLCGFVCTSSLFRDLLDGLMEIHDITNISRIPKYLPVLLIGGMQDPVGKFGKAVQGAAVMFRDVGVRNVTVKLYHEARHELFNELNRDEVISDVAAWFEEHVAHTTV